MTISTGTYLLLVYLKQISDLRKENKMKAKTGLFFVRNDTCPLDCSVVKILGHFFFFLLYLCDSKLAENTVQPLVIFTAF